MSRLLSAGGVVVAGLAIGMLFIVGVHAATPEPPSPFHAINAATNLPPIPYVKSPVDLFRDLLAMSLSERRNYLTNRPPAIRARILEKLREYEALDPNERELRLTATELHWYLPTLMRLSPADRTVRLAVIPPATRTLLQNRLEQWDLLPPSMQKEFLDNQQTLGFFTHIDNGVQEQSGSHHSSTNHYSWEDALARWNALPEAERQSLSEQFTSFFSLTPSEKNKTLNTLSDAERQQMETTLQAFEKLPPDQRATCIHSFEQFSSMSPQQRFEFLRNAERWSKMSLAERQAWRDLVAHVPQWPPLPQEFLNSASPPIPHVSPRIPRGVALATNAN